MTDPTKENTMAIFAPLKAALEARPTTLADLQELIAGFLQTDQQVGYAMLMHSRDIDLELVQAKEPPMAYPQLVAEIYRRTFFDLDYAALYHTQAMLKKGPDALKMMSDFIINDMLAAEIPGVHPAPGTHQ